MNFFIYVRPECGCNSIVTRENLHASALSKKSTIVQEKYICEIEAFNQLTLLLKLQDKISNEHMVGTIGVFKVYTGFFLEISVRPLPNQFGLDTWSAVVVSHKKFLNATQFALNRTIEYYRISDTREERKWMPHFIGYNIGGECILATLTSKQLEKRIPDLHFLQLWKLNYVAHEIFYENISSYNYEPLFRGRPKIYKVV